MIGIYNPPPALADQSHPFLLRIFQDSKAQIICAYLIFFGIASVITGAVGLVKDGNNDQSILPSEGPAKFLTGIGCVATLIGGYGLFISARNTTKNSKSSSMLDECAQTKNPDEVAVPNV